jgi:predicted dehydrogenase
VNWLSPTKVRTMIFGGTDQTLVWDDLNPQQRVSIFDRKIDLGSDPNEVVQRSRVSYRIGDVTSPALPDKEALSAVVDELVAGVRGEAEPVTDGISGLRVLQILDASDKSLNSGGASIDVTLAERES